MKRLLNASVVLCDDCVSGLEFGTWVEEEMGTCARCLFNKNKAICVLCRTETHYYLPRHIPQFESDKSKLYGVAWNRFLGIVSIALCIDCSSLGFLPTYATTEWVELSNGWQWLYPNLDFNEPPTIDVEQIRSRHLAGF